MQKTVPCRHVTFIILPSMTSRTCHDRIQSCPLNVANWLHLSFTFFEGLDRIHIHQRLWRMHAILQPCTCCPSCCVADKVISFLAPFAPVSCQRWGAILLPAQFQLSLDVPMKNTAAPLMVPLECVTQLVVLQRLQQSRKPAVMPLCSCSSDWQK